MSSEKQKFSQRLNEALDDMNYPRMGHGRQSALAKELKLSAQVVGGWLKGESFPKTSQLVKVSQFLDVRSNWLLSGVGLKYPKKHVRPDRVVPAETRENREDTHIEITADDSPKMDKEAFQVALAWIKLPDLQRAALKKVIIELSESAAE